MSEEEICIGRRSGKTYNKIQEMAKEIDKLQKELEEKTTILMAGADKVKQLEKENKELKDDKEGLINGYKDTEDKLVELRAKYNELQKENAELKEKEYEKGETSNGLR